MATELTKAELEITKDIINVGLLKAADSLSFFIREKVMIEINDIKINTHDRIPLSRKEPVKKSYLLMTNILGDIGGKAYLIFNELEVEKLVDANLPDSIKNNPAEKAEMTDAILLEIDNIITASVITQFSNIFQRKLYGDVPSLTILPENETNQFLNANHQQGFDPIYFNAKFISENIEIHPEFIWFMDDKFSIEVKNVMADEKKIETLQKLQK
jgi:chemotaxis protein CheY-P-specific phosphatase CheC